MDKENVLLCWCLAMFFLIVIMGAPLIIIADKVPEIINPSFMRLFVLLLGVFSSILFYVSVRKERMNLKKDKVI